MLLSAQTKPDAYHTALSTKHATKGDSRLHAMIIRSPIFDGITAARQSSTNRSDAPPQLAKPRDENVGLL